MSDSKQKDLLTVLAEPSDDLKALIADHRDDLAQTRAAIELYSRQAERAHPRNIASGLLAAMASEAANDAPESELKQLGQWVFEGQSEEWVSAAWDGDGGVWLFKRPSKELKCSARDGYFFWYTDDAVANKFACYLAPYSEMNLDSIIQKLRLIDRETVNDVDYLSSDLDDSVPHIDDVVDQPNWLSESAPQITQADMQLIFIKNLSDVLIQRMHSMDRFSEDDYHVGGDKLMSWDIIISPDDNKFGFITGHALDNSEFSLFFIGFFAEDTRLASALYKSALELCELKTRTITEAEIPAFRAALEACYA